MSLRSLQLHPISTSHYYTSGDVTIQAGVAIAPGVLIQADPNSRVVIKSGACIGIGAILHAHNGVVEIGEGANIGAEVLLVGQVQVGSQACVGTATTIVNSNVKSGQIIPPGSLIESTDHDVHELKATDTVIYPDSQTDSESLATEDAPSEEGSDLSPVEGSPSPEINVYGQVYVNRMFVRMFPNHPRSQSLESNEESQLAEADPWNE